MTIANGVYSEVEHTGSSYFPLQLCFHQCQDMKSVLLMLVTCQVSARYSISPIFLHATTCNYTRLCPSEYEDIYNWRFGVWISGFQFSRSFYCVLSCTVIKQGPISHVLYIQKPQASYTKIPSSLLQYFLEIDSLLHTQNSTAGVSWGMTNCVSITLFRINVTINLIMLISSFCIHCYH